jgi:type IV pilus assembly protein PilE
MRDSIDTVPCTRHSSRNGTLRRHVAGVTLLELMIVVTVIAVLGMIAVPSYRQYSMRAHRTDAKTALLRLSANQERFYLQNRRYGGTADLAALGFPSGKSEKGAYAITVPVANTATYTARAAPTAGGAFDMTDDAQCTAFSITAQGARTATGTAAATCW